MWDPAQIKHRARKTNPNPPFLPSSKPRAAPAIILSFFVSRKTQICESPGRCSLSQGRQMGTLELPAALPSELLIPPQSHQHQTKAAIKAHPAGSEREGRKTKRHKSRGLCLPAASSGNEPRPAAPDPFELGNSGIMECPELGGTNRGQSAAPALL